MSKKADYGRGGIDDCPRCHLHYINPNTIKIEGKTKWQVICANCYFTGPIANTPRFAIREWNKMVNNYGEGDVFEG